MRRLGRLDAMTAIFFCCDVQEPCRESIYRFPAVVHTSAAMLSAARSLGIPCAVTQHHPKELKPAADGLDLTGCVESEKTCFTMLSGNVRDWLESTPELSARRSVVLFGVEAHVCVQQTALDLLEQGRDVHILVDGVSSRLASDRAVALVRCQQAGAFLSTSEAVLMELLRGEDHAEFRRIADALKARPEAPLGWPC